MTAGTTGSITVQKPVVCGQVHFDFSDTNKLGEIVFPIVLALLATNLSPGVL